MTIIEFYNTLEEVKVDISRQAKRLEDTAEASGLLGLRELGLKLTGVASHLSTDLLRLQKLEIPNGKES